MRKLLLFDVDQTILSTRGGDRKALNIAFEALFGIRDGFEEIQFAGRMDLAIVGDAFRMWDVDHAGDPETIAKFKDAYFKALEIVLRGWTRGREYPGVRELLGCLSRRKDVDLGLATGNFRKAAFIKLTRYGFDGFFTEGGFGGDSVERSEVVAIAIKRCQMQTDTVYSKENIWVIGDSPSDVQAGKSNGVKTIAVTTGFYSQEQLKQYGPTYVFPDLSDMEAFLAHVLGAGTD